MDLKEKIVEEVEEAVKYECGSGNKNTLTFVRVLGKIS